MKIGNIFLLSSFPSMFPVLIALILLNRNDDHKLSSLILDFKEKNLESLTAEYVCRLET